MIRKIIRKIKVGGHAPPGAKPFSEFDWTSGIWGPRESGPHKRVYDEIDYENRVTWCRCVDCGLEWREGFGDIEGWETCEP